MQFLTYASNNSKRISGFSQMLCSTNVFNINNKKCFLRNKSELWRQAPGLDQRDTHKTIRCLKHSTHMLLFYVRTSHKYLITTYYEYQQVNYLYSSFSKRNWNEDCLYSNCKHALFNIIRRCNIRTDFHHYCFYFCLLTCSLTWTINQISHWWACHWVSNLKLVTPQKSAWQTLTNNCLSP